MRYVMATALAVAMAALPAHAKVLRYSTNADLLGLDPAINNEGPTNAMKTNLYEGLLSRNFDLSLSPGLATEWSQVSPEVWRFKLRQGVKFHDGTPFTAEDVAFSVGRYNADQSDMKGYTATIKEVKVVDPSTIDVLTLGPDPILPQQLPLFFIMSKAWAEKNNTTQVVRGTSAPTFINFNANGTGPYKLVERVADNRTVVEPNPNWWGKLDNGITRAEFRPIANAATRVAALLSGEIDLMYPVPSQDKQRINSTKGTKVLEGPELRTIFLGFDQHRDELLDMKGSGKNPFKDKRVREAFYKAIDIQTIARVVMRGESRPTGSMVAPGIAGFSDDVDKRPAFNADEAKKLLADAGYPNGFPVTFDCPNDRYTNDEAICQSIVPMLTRVGIQIKLNAQTRSLHFDKIGLKENRNTSFYMLGWTPGTFDAHNMLVNIVTMDGPGAGQNNSGAYRNPKVEELTLKAGTEMDPKKRLEMLVEAQKIHKDDYGHIPLHQQTLAWGVRDEVIDGSVKPRPSNDVELRLIKMK